MKFNSFIWNTFIESAGGREWVDFFANLKERYSKRDEKLLRFISNWSSGGTVNDKILSADAEIKDVLNALKELDQATKDRLLPEKVENCERADSLFYDIGDLVTDDETEELFYVDDISRLSVALFCLYPKFFFPYYFYPSFHVLKTICDEFGIFLPPVPPKQDYHARFFYYLELCRSLRDFWTHLNLPFEHLPVFLYGFAPEVVDLKHPDIKDLPKPQRAWFVGGGISNNGDFDYLDKINGSSQTFWQGNKETEIGDIIVMYGLAPRSHIHSIWRAIRPGGVEPFRSFYGTIWMGYPQLVKPLTLKKIKADPILSQMPLVKGSMQGINGRLLPKRFYDRILSLLERNGTDVSCLPLLEDIEIKDLRIKNERDVEIRILEPLLEELGFKPSDWQRQVKLRVGRAEKVIPDYLIFSSKNVAAKSVRAEWVWEAKMSIPSNDQLQKDFGQVASYGRLVGATGVGLVSKEGVWISLKEHDYSFEKARHWSAHKIREIDALGEIRTLAGKRRLGGRERRPDSKTS